MNFKIISIILTAIGSIGLIISLFPAKYICQIDKKNCISWKALGALILFFIFGYVFFISMVLNGTGSAIELAVSLILCGGGIFVPLVINLSIRSINRIITITKREEHRAAHDALTNLPNRAKLLEQVVSAINYAEITSQTVSLLLLDIDRFKEINDALGHQHGDYLLQLTAARLYSCTRETDTISRLGGDEFAIVLPGADLDQAISVSEKVARIMEEPFLVKDYNIKIEISIGIAMYPDHGTDSEELLKRADIAMYTAKRRDRVYAIYDMEQDKYTMDRLKLTEELRDGIKNQHLLLHYQPKVSIANNKICGVEALVRWQHANQQILLYPDEFVMLAEQTGLIKALTLSVLDKALGQASTWHQAEFEIPMSINISIKNLQDLNFPFQVKELLEKWQVDASMLTFEITESSVMLDPERTFEVISNLCSLGLHISIDDFGTGYSSLAYLKQLPAAEIKIDKSFVIDMLDDENDAVIVRSTIDLANNMGLRVVAEGVENQHILEQLSRLGCDIMQGHHICPPLPPEKIFSLTDNEMLITFAAA